MWLIIWILTFLQEPASINYDATAIGVKEIILEILFPGIVSWSIGIKSDAPLMIIMGGFSFICNFLMFYTMWIIIAPIQVITLIIFKLKMCPEGGSQQPKPLKPQTMACDPAVAKKGSILNFFFPGFGSLLVYSKTKNKHTDLAAGIVVTLWEVACLLLLIWDIWSIFIPIWYWLAGVILSIMHTNYVKTWVENGVGNSSGSAPQQPQVVQTTTTTTTTQQYV